MKTLAVLISGRGSNLRSLIEAANNYQVIAVYSNRGDALGLDHARNFKIPYYIFEKNDQLTAKQQKELLFDHLQKLNPDLIALAGFMSIVPADFIQKFPNRILNIHPSLLPNFPGLDTHKRAIESKEKLHGCTVHYVDEGLDTGEIIAQRSCPILDDDTEESLSARVLKMEHQLYPEVLNSLCLIDN